MHGSIGRDVVGAVAAVAARRLVALDRDPVLGQIEQGGELTREQEHAWEPKGAAQVMDVRGGLDAEGGPAAYDFELRP
jgi:nicotinate dehydrogenase subunit B